MRTRTKILLTTLAAALAWTLGQTASFVSPNTGGTSNYNGTNAAVTFSLTNNSANFLSNNTPGTLAYLTNTWTLIAPQTNFPGTNASLGIATNTVAGYYAAGFTLSWQALIQTSFEFAITTNGVAVPHTWTFATNGAANTAQEVSAWANIYLPVTNIAVAVMWRSGVSADLRVRSGTFSLNMIGGGIGPTGATGATGPSGAQINDDRIIFNGDSMSTWVSPITTYVSNTWTYMLTTNYPWSGFQAKNITNFAANGRYAQEIWGLWGSQEATVPSTNYQGRTWWFAQAGINDIINNYTNSDMGTFDTYVNLSNIWRLARSNHFTTVAFTILPWSNMTVIQTNYMLQLNERIKQSRGQYDYLIDINSLFPTYQPSQFIDAFHLTAASNFRLSQTINSNLNWGGGVQGIASYRTNVQVGGNLYVNGGTYSYNNPEAIATNGGANSAITVDYGIPRRVIYVTNSTVSFTNSANLPGTGLGVSAEIVVVPILGNVSVTYPDFTGAVTYDGLKWTTNWQTAPAGTLTQSVFYVYRWTTHGTNARVEMFAQNTAGSFGSGSGGGGGAGVPLRALAAGNITITVGNTNEQAVYFGTNSDFTATFTGTPATTGERLSIMVSNVAPAANIVMTFNGITPFDMDTKTTVSSLTIASNSITAIRMEYTTNRNIGWIVLSKDGFGWGLSNGTFTVLSTNGPGKVIAYDLSSTSGSGVSVVLTNGAKINAPTITGQVTVDPTTQIGTIGVGLPAMIASNITFAGGSGSGNGISILSLNSAAAVEFNSQNMSSGTATTNIDLGLSPYKNFTNVMSGNLTLNITNLGAISGRGFTARFLGAATTTNTVKFSVVPTTGTNITWLSATNGSYDFQVLPNQTVVVQGIANSPTNIDMSWSTSARLPITVQAGQSTSNAVVAGYIYGTGIGLFTNLNAAGTISNMQVLSLSAHTLTNVGDVVIAEWRGKFKNSTVSSNQFQLTFGSTTALDTGMQSSSNTSWHAWMEITKTGNNAQHIDAYFSFGSQAPFASTNINIEATENMGTALTVALKGGASALGSYTNNAFRIKYVTATQ